VRTDASGTFRVDGLEIGHNIVHVPLVEYRGVGYFPDRPVMLESPEPAAVELMVFEATPRPDAVTFDRLNMLVMGATPTALTIMEMGAAVNASDRTFAADVQATGSARTLRFLLPTGAIQVTPQAGLPVDTLESMPDGFATTDPVRPGRREIAFSYQLPYNSSSIDLSRSFALPVGTFTLFVPPEIGGVVAPGMALQGTAELGGRQFRQYTVERLAPGTEVRFRMVGLPAPFFARPRDLGVLVVGLSSAALLGFLVVAVRRRWSSPEASSLADSLPTNGSATVDEAERLALIREVAQLDERYAAGGVDESSYRAERAEHKARLLALSGFTSAGQP
jgi:hypothetical protein